MSKEKRPSSNKNDLASDLSQTPLDVHRSNRKDSECSEIKLLLQSTRFLQK